MFLDTVAWGRNHTVFMRCFWENQIGHCMIQNDALNESFWFWYSRAFLTFLIFSVSSREKENWTVSFSLTSAFVFAVFTSAIFSTCKEKALQDTSMINKYVFHWLHHSVGQAVKKQCQEIRKEAFWPPLILVKDGLPADNEQTLSPVPIPLRAVWYAGEKKSAYEIFHPVHESLHCVIFAEHSAPKKQESRSETFLFVSHQLILNCFNPFHPPIAVMSTVDEREKQRLWMTINDQVVHYITIG